MFTHKAVQQIQKRSIAAREGFTMIELMVVIVVLGMLATIVTYNVLQVQEDAEVRATQAQIKALETALMAYRLEFGHFPSSGEGLAALLNNNKGKNFLQGSTSVPKDAWNREFEYSMPGPDGARYEIKSLGADGSQGGEGVNADISSTNLKGDE